MLAPLPSAPSRIRASYSTNECSVRASISFIATVPARPCLPACLSVYDSGSMERRAAEVIVARTWNTRGWGMSPAHQLSGGLFWLLYAARRRLSRARRRSLLLLSQNGRARLATLPPALAECNSTASRYVCARLLCCRAIRARHCCRVFRCFPLQRNLRARNRSSSRRALLCPTPTHALPTSSLRLRLPRRAVRCCCRRRESLGTGPGAQGEALDMPGGEHFVHP